MRALVTGATGFLGAALVRHLVVKGWTVTALGRHRASVQTCLLERMEDATLLAEIFETTRPDVIFHLAGCAVGSVDEMRRINVDFAAAIIAAAKRSDPSPRIVFAGTAAEYGLVPLDELPVTEDRECHPSGDYGATKLRQTALGLSAAKEGVPVFLPRLFNLIGPGMRPHLSFGRFAREIAILYPHGGVLVTGPLDAQRDVVSVDEAARVLAEICLLPEAAGTIINVCSGRAIRVRTVLEHLIAAANIPIVVETVAGIGGVSTVEQMIGCGRRLAALGVQLLPPDLRTETARIMAAALEAQAVTSVMTR